jgi:hypothetical protein
MMAADTSSVRRSGLGAAAVERPAAGVIGEALSARETG